MAAARSSSHPLLFTTHDALLDTVVKPPSLISRVQHGNIAANHNCTCDAAFGLVVGFELGVAGDYGNTLEQRQSYSDEKTSIRNTTISKNSAHVGRHISLFRLYGTTPTNATPSCPFASLPAKWNRVPNNAAADMLRVAPNSPSHLCLRPGRSAASGVLSKKL